MVRRWQETEDRRYQSTLYPEIPARTHSPRVTVAREIFLLALQRGPAHERIVGSTGRHNREVLRPSSIYSLTVSHRMKQPPLNIKAAKEVEQREPARPCSTHQPPEHSAYLYTFHSSIDQRLFTIKDTV